MNPILKIATRLASLCSELKFIEVYIELYAGHAISIDPNNNNEPIGGLDQLIEYEKRFLANVDIHEINVSKAIVAGSYFSLVFSMRFTVKRQASKMVEEICVYKVEHGKIVSQQFFIG
jgi:hypothetical protein